jgi:outer membrane protein TolC
LREAAAGLAGSGADYKQTVLSAFQEVEDQLAALRVLQQEALKQDQAVSAAQQSLQLELNQYRVGSVGYLDVVVAQNAALADQRGALDLARRRMDASVELIKALAGGWAGA